LRLPPRLPVSRRRPAAFTRPDAFLRRPRAPFPRVRQTELPVRKTRLPELVANPAASLTGDNRRLTGPLVLLRRVAAILIM
jgi:hypothetical protein